MKEIRIMTFALILAVFLLMAGCRTVPAPQESGEQAGTEKEATAAQEQVDSPKTPGEEGPFPGWENGPMADSFRRDYTMEEVVQDIVQFHRMLESYDYFGQYTRGDAIFEDYLVTIFGIENGPYYEGKGVELSLYGQNGEVQNSYRRVLLEKNEDGSLWQQRQSQFQQEIFYETQVGPYGVPREIRYRDVPTGRAVGRSTFLGENVAEVEGQLSPEEIQARLDEERGEEVRMYMPPFYQGLKEAGRETVKAAGREVYTVRFTAEAAAEHISELELYYSPDVPGGVVRLSINGQALAEISEWIDMAEQVIAEDEVMKVDQFAAVPVEGPAAAPGVGPGAGPGSGSEGYRSEGSADEPVELFVGEEHYGAVLKGEKSYYKVVAPERGDLHCEVMDMNGAGVLQNYVGDSSYSEWRSGSEGGRLNFTEYFVQTGDSIYFTIEAQEDQDIPGLAYRVVITSDPMLDSLGVRMYADYRAEAKALETGESVRIEAAPGDLRYFAVQPGDKDELQLTIRNISSGELDFRFLEVLDGSYGGMSGMQRSADEKVIRVNGLSEGSTAYFYLIAAPWIETRPVSVTVE
ncbi:MAG: hypothetical protein SVR04_03145 [Spirochaetota bacterium]|nr:hypothetical protein [Spirochaetota bacterium]